MEWSADGIIIGTRKHGETSLIVELMTRERGRHLGLVRGGRSRKMQPFLQPGNSVSVVWRARLDEHLGTYSVEPLALNAARFMDSASAINAIQLIGSHLRLLAERDPHPGLFDATEVMVDHLTDTSIIGPLMVRLELKLLDELGFGLDLTQCAGSGRRDDLAYVSPKSGCAVNRETGAAWADKLLPLPRFLTATSERTCSADELAAAMGMTGYFLNRDVWAARGIEPPASRDSFLRALQKALVTVS